MPEVTFIAMTSVLLDGRNKDKGREKAKTNKTTLMKNK
jgi:hypothetical protein